MTRTFLTLLTAAALLVSPSAASAETGGAGLLPAGSSLPAGYRSNLDEPNGLQLIKPPATLPYNRDGEAGTIRFYAGVRFRGASRRLGVTKVRISLLSAGGRHLVSQCTVRRSDSARWKYVYLDRLGSVAGEQPQGAGAGEAYTIRYTVIRTGHRKRIRRDFAVAVSRSA